ncbi:MAG: 4-hydroxy-tetrahydrodipicolinate reductase [Longimicrobiales bacterium]
MATRICVSGATGRMGRELARLAESQPGIEIVGGVARRAARDTESRILGYPCITQVSDADDVLTRADVLVDFSAPELLGELMEAHPKALAGRALVVGTTGLEPWLVRRLDHAAHDAAVLIAPNFSVGVNLLLALVERAAAVLDPTEYDIEILETHHRHKTDAPSGTALTLGEAASRGRGVALSTVRRDGRTGNTGERPAGEIGFHSVRGGEVPGAHRILFLGARERIEFGHLAQDRSLFAEGALRAARWIAGKAPGRYGMREVLGL